MSTKKTKRVSRPKSEIDGVIEDALRRERDALMSATESGVTSLHVQWSRGFAHGSARLREQLERMRGYEMDIV